ncbi:MAG: DUF2726 domain-containing protein [Proteobacteria bacterium]|nr:DUF2726 domain-containing protein [Pseudomonadota bacterium]HMT16989.1 DUF2726 domain-containing protein [Ottowia sp.]
MNNPWLWMAPALLLLVALAAFRLLRRRGGAERPLGEDDRFAPVAALSPAEMALLDYLVRAFPGRPVLFRVPLSRLLTVRRAGSRLGAQQRLAALVVDYVVCNRDGRPVYAFELDAVHGDAGQAEQDAREKHRVLKTAGVRLIRLKRSTRYLPRPDEFRRHLRAAALPAQDTPAAEAADPWQGAERARPTPVRGAEPPRDAGDTIPMTVTDLMGLHPAVDDDAEPPPDRG